jgi:hypothetical protein
VYYVPVLIVPFPAPKLKSHSLESTHHWRVPQPKFPAQLKSHPQVKFILPVSSPATTEVLRNLSVTCQNLSPMLQTCVVGSPKHAGVDLLCTDGRTQRATAPRMCLVGDDCVWQLLLNQLKVFVHPIYALICHQHWFKCFTPCHVPCHPSTWRPHCTTCPPLSLTHQRSSL